MKKILFSLPLALAAALSSCGHQDTPAATLTNGASASAPAPERVLKAADIRACQASWSAAKLGADNLNCAEGKAAGKTEQNQACNITISKAGNITISGAKVASFSPSASTLYTARYLPASATALGLEQGFFMMRDTKAAAVSFLIGNQGNELAVKMDDLTCSATLQ